MTKGKGRFIVIEGGEGAGKTTMVNALREHFPNVLRTREPGGAPFAEQIRSIILSPDARSADANTQFGLFWAARADHMKNTIIPALLAGKHVVTDRFDASSFAYQIRGQENAHLEKLFFAVRDVYLGEWQPDRYFFFDVPPEVGLRRRAEEKGNVLNHFDQRDLAFHQRIYSGYKEFFTKVPHTIIDATQSLKKVQADFLDELRVLLA